MKNKNTVVYILSTVCLLFSLFSINNAVGTELTERERANTERFLKILHEQKSLLESLTAPEIWLLGGAYFFPVIEVRREQVIKAITLNYYKELISQGLVFNKEELNKRIRKFKNQSDTIKLELMEEIRRLNKLINKENSSLINMTREQQQIQPAPNTLQIDTPETFQTSGETNRLTCLTPYSRIEYMKTGKTGVGFPKYRYNQYRLKFGFFNDCKDIVYVSGTYKYTTGHGTDGLNTSQLDSYRVGPGVKRWPIGTYIYSSDRVGPAVFEFNGEAEINGVKYPLSHKGQFKQ